MPGREHEEGALNRRLWHFNAEGDVTVAVAVPVALVGGGEEWRDEIGRQCHNHMKECTSLASVARIGVCGDKKHARIWVQSHRRSRSWAEYCSQESHTSSGTPPLFFCWTRAASNNVHVIMRSRSNDMLVLLHTRRKNTAV